MASSSSARDKVTYFAWRYVTDKKATPVGKEQADRIIEACKNRLIERSERLSGQPSDWTLESFSVDSDVLPSHQIVYLEQDSSRPITVADIDRSQARRVSGTPPRSWNVDISYEMHRSNGDLERGNHTCTYIEQPHEDEERVIIQSGWGIAMHK